MLVARGAQRPRDLEEALATTGTALCKRHLPASKWVARHRGWRVPDTEVNRAHLGARRRMPTVIATTERSADIRW